VTLVIAMMTDDDEAEGRMRMRRRNEWEDR
jgi:hypothetical protein